MERAASAADGTSPEADYECNMAKVFALEEIMKVTQHCVELHGGNGMMLDFGRETVSPQILLHMDGTVDVSRMKIIKSDVPAHGRQICRSGITDFPFESHNSGDDTVSYVSRLGTFGCRPTSSYPPPLSSGHDTAFRNAGFTESR